MTTTLLVLAFFCKVRIALAALISAMMLAPSTSAQTSNIERDTFEYSPKTEYVTNPADTLADDVYDLAANPVGNKEKGEFFNKWFWSMFACMDENGKFQDSKLGNAPKYIKVPNQDYRQLAADIMCTFDENGDNKIDYTEYANKSEQLMNEKAGRTLPPDVRLNFNRNFFTPLFNGFDYDRNLKEYNIDEIAATLYALDRYSSSGQGILSGERLMDEVNYVLENGSTDKCFNMSRATYYQENVRK